MKCAVCGKEWNGSGMYCPACGSPVVGHPTRRWLWEVLLVLGMLALLAWLLLKPV